MQEELKGLRVGGMKEKIGNNQRMIDEIHLINFYMKLLSSMIFDTSVLKCSSLPKSTFEDHSGPRNRSDTFY